MKYCLPFLMLMTSCASDWDNYPHSLYGALKNDHPRAVVLHQQLLEKIYVGSLQAGRKPPAGIAAEYAFYSWKIGKPEIAQAALAAERENYPESAQFVGLLERFLPSVEVIKIPADSTGGASDDGF